ncbi:MAG: hypothetical protein KKD99_01000 [Proteobacteria bacterium]|nr:hypothetical protein [Pseudomonadota bacterium]MBU4447131.1 hypothetical protein [Pseudomonadota bacterium]MCG2773807.1 hypothetical protein [Desulfobacterales bacterium]
MAYDAAKDQEIKAWQHENGLYVSLYQYNGGAPKVQIGPRGYQKADSSEGFGKVGRMSLEEMGWLFGLKEEIRAAAKEGMGK